MSPQEYINNALRTESDEYSFGETNGVTARIEHGVMGIVTEAGELMDAIKKSKIYNKELDRVNLAEEAGDIMWYLAILCDELDVSFESVWEKNIAKLKARYPEKYSDHHALNRDVDSERKILES